MLLGELIDELRLLPQNAYIFINKSPVSLVPRGVNSYRGYYDQLAIEVETDRYGQMVSLLLAELEAALDRAFQGYKGGEYRYTRETPVWLSNYGEVSDVQVTGTRQRGGFVYLKWKKIS